MVRLDGRERPLTGHQFDLLAALAESAGRVLSREALMERVRGDAWRPSTAASTSTSRGSAPPSRTTRAIPRRILTVRGAGYVFARGQDEADAPPLPPGLPRVPGHPPRVRGAGGRWPGTARPGAAGPGRRSRGGGLLADLLPAGRGPRASSEAALHGAGLDPSTSNLSLWSADGESIAVGGRAAALSGPARRAGADGCRRAAGPSASCGFPTAAGWWRASGQAGLAHAGLLVILAPARRGRGRRGLSRGAPAHAAPGAPAGGRGGPGRRRPRGPRAGGGPRRGGGPGHELQPRRRPHRGGSSAPSARCWPARPTSCARPSRASAWPWS